MYYVNNTKWIFFILSILTTPTTSSNRPQLPQLYNSLSCPHNGIVSIPETFDTTVMIKMGMIAAILEQWCNPKQGENQSAPKQILKFSNKKKKLEEQHLTRYKMLNDQKKIWYLIL